MPTTQLVPRPIQRSHRQVDLPPTPAQSPLPLPGPPICPHELWRALGPGDQARIRQALLRIIQEVVDDAHHH